MKNQLKDWKEEWDTGYTKFVPELFELCEKLLEQKEMTTMNIHDSDTESHTITFTSGDNKLDLKPDGLWFNDNRLDVDKDIVEAFKTFFIMSHDIQWVHKIKKELDAERELHKTTHDLLEKTKWELNHWKESFHKNEQQVETLRREIANIRNEILIIKKENQDAK